MYSTLLFWKTFGERDIFEQRRRQVLTTFVCLDFTSHPPNSLCLLFRAEYAECKEIIKDTDKS